MAIFKCLQSGNTVEFTQQHDIDSMKGHGGYVRVDEPPEPESANQLPLLASDTTKRLGRPRRATETI